LEKIENRFGCLSAIFAGPASLAIQRGLHRHGNNKSEGGRHLSRDRVSSFKKAADSGIWGVIHKATTGATGTDKKYKDRRTSAVAAGLLLGAYHWGTHADVAKQVDNFLKSSGSDPQTLVALDFEDTPGNQMTLDQAREFMTRVADKLGRKPVLYSGHLIKEKAWQ